MMFISNIGRKLNDISISKRLYLTIAFTVLLITSALSGYLVDPKLVFLLSLGIGMCSILLTLSVHKNLKKGLGSIASCVQKIKEGELKSHAGVYSKDEIGGLAMAFNEMANVLDKNIKDQKQHFLINMSHEIRTPMNAILGFARHLEESLYEKDQQESIKMIIKSGDHLLMTFNDILDFSRIGTGKIDFMVLPFDLNETIQSIFMLTEPHARFKKVGLTYSIDNDIPKMLYGDSVRLTQILLNLTSNAIKFTERGGVIISVAKVGEGLDDVVVEFRIKDTGIGIAPEKMDKIFEVFEQGTNSMSRKFGGTGIGLSIVKRLITLQGGKISVDSTPGRGSEFYFSLPFSKQNSYEDENGVKENLNHNEESRKEGEGIKVLIVEDNAINQLLVLKLLQKRGYDTTVAENGQIALHKYDKADFDIILMDLRMPEMDGYEATIQIRKMDSYKRFVPIVAMTAHTIKGEYERCMSIGMNDYISKPFRAAELYEKIQLLVKKAGQQI